MPLPSGMDSTAPYNTTRARPCPSAVSLVVQLWQARQSLQLVRSAERRLRIRHGAILRIRPDIFFFRPVELPRPPPGLASWYSMLEESCHVREGVSEAVYGKASLRFLQDFWLYGSRDVMDVALQEPLERLLGLVATPPPSWPAPRATTGPPRSPPTARWASRAASASRGRRPSTGFHPVPEALNHHYNESRQCLKYTSPYGLPREPRRGVLCGAGADAKRERGDARSRRRSGGRSTSRARIRPIETQGAEPALPRGRGVRVPPLLRPRLEPQLPADRRRPRLFSGAEAPCLRSPTIRCADADGLAAAAGAAAAVSRCAAPGWRRWWGRCTIGRGYG